MKEIEVTIDENGEISVDLTGYRGKGCAVDSDAFIKALGKVKSREKKNEYWKPKQKQTQKPKEINLLPDRHNRQMLSAVG